MNARQRRIRARAVAREVQSRSDVVLASFGRPIMLAASVSELTDSSGPVWVETCLSGVYLGHSNAKRLDWGPALFQSLIDNLHANPSFKADANGAGCVPVIPWDYEHESEIAKMNLSRGVPLPPGGLPARAWTYDLAIRPGEDGTPSLWALTEFLPEALLQIRGKKYRWCSLAVSPSFTNPVSGVDQGPTVTSIALTNDPFIQGMVPLAATRSPITQTLDQWGPAESLEEALIGLRKIFELEDSATPDEVLKQIQTLRSLIESGAVPEYLGLENVMDRMRRLLELPLLSLPADVLGGAEAAVNQLLAGGVAADSSATNTEGKENPMGANAMNTALAAILRCKSDDDQTILQAATKAKQDAEAGAEALDGFSKLKGLLGGEDMATTIANCTKMLADAKQLGPVLEALNAAQAAMKGTANADAENEAQLVAASMARGDQALEAKFKPVILAARKGCIDEKTGAVDEAKLAKFREDYPLESEQKALLTRRLVAGPNGTQLGGAMTGYRSEVITQSRDNGAPASDVQKVVEAFNSSPGRNPVEKANALLCSRNQAHKALPFGEQCRVAGEFVRTLQRGQVPAGFTI